MDERYIEFVNHLRNDINPSYQGGVAIAISGGADSLCLCVLLTKFCKEYSLKLYPIIVDHGLRLESKAEANSVKNYLKEKLGLESIILTWEGKKPKSNVHHHARKARYRLLIDYCKEHNIKYLCTAHNKDDQAETVMLRILRGSGLDGVAGIPSNQAIDDVMIIRPLLIWTRKDIEEFLGTKYTWVFDPSNNDFRYSRTRVRTAFKELLNQEVIESYDLLLQRFSLLSSNIQRTLNFIDCEVTRILRKLVKLTSYGNIELDLVRFARIHEELQLRILRHILLYIGGDEFPVRLESLMLLREELLTLNFKKRTLGKCELIVLSNNTLVCFKELEFAQSNFIELKPNKSLLWDNRITIKVNKQGFHVGKISNNSILYIKEKLPLTSLLLNYKWHLLKRVILTMPAIFYREKPITYPLLNMVDERNTKGIILPQIHCKFSKL